MSELRYIKQWCDDAVSYIRFPRDRIPVRQELLEHMEDAYDCYIGKGQEPAQAERSAIRDMGDARETGKLLAKIHKPYWGWVWTATVVLLWGLVILIGVSGIGWGLGLIEDMAHYDGVNTHRTRDVYGEDYYHYTSEEMIYEYEAWRTFFAEPMVSDSSDGYQLTVTRMAEWQGVSRDTHGERESADLYFTIEVTNPRPWAGCSDIPRWLYAVDSLGNYYDASNANRGRSEPGLAGNPYQTGPFTYTWDMWMDHYTPNDAQWLEFRYDRDGRDIVLRVDLTGGEGA